MSHTIEIRRASRGAVIVPAGEVELCLAMGWVLCDEPHCRGARMLPPSSVHRVPETLGSAGMKNARLAGGETGQKQFDNARLNERRLQLQARR